ncbi:HNH endonuclease [Sulfitobacter sp. 1A12157]|uniref:HNH endonuclease n=1 Tax=Sulfitobacter sp. 1A12157 TaxID=3368594 RepID=UPI0037455766
MTQKKPPCPTILRQLLRYEPETGKLFWRTLGAAHFGDTTGRKADHTQKNWNAKYAGKEAFTCANASGHKRGNIRGKGLLAHRVAWAIYYGSWPDGIIDHVDMNPANNAIDNLRLATKRQNGCNRRTVGRSKYLGVCWHKAAKKWKASISVYNRSTYLGVFENEEDAAAAYDRAARKFHGEFSRLNFPDQ